MSLSQTDDAHQGAISQMVQRITASFMHIKLRKEDKEGYMEVRRNSLRTELQNG